MTILHWTAYLQGRYAVLAPPPITRWTHAVVISPRRSVRVSIVFQVTAGMEADSSLAYLSTPNKLLKSSVQMMFDSALVNQGVMDVERYLWELRGGRL